MNYWHYSFISQIRRKNGNIEFHKGNHVFYRYSKEILRIEELIQIINPSILQKNKFIVIEGPILVETDSINDIIYTDMNGRRALNKDVKVLCWF